MTKREYKRIIDDFITRRYNHLIECSKNILRGNKSSCGDIVAELVIYLYENQEKLEDYIDMDMLEGFSVSWLRLQAQYSTTPFNRKYHKLNEEIDVNKNDESVELDIDNINDDEYIKDLRTIYTDKQVKNILKIHDIYPTLSKPKQILFDAYFLQGLSYDKIKDNYTFHETKKGKKVYYRSRTSISKLMCELKDEIKKKL